MSVNKNHYVMIGMKFGYDEFFDLCIESGAEDTTGDQWDTGPLVPYIDSFIHGIEQHDFLTVIIDGMNGNYVYVGHVVQKSSYENGSLNDFVTKDTWIVTVQEDGGIENIEKGCEEVYALIIGNFGMEFGTKSANLHCFTHWT